MWMIKFPDGNEMLFCTAVAAACAFNQFQGRGVHLISPSGKRIKNKEKLEKISA